jgi:hypothetical protein
MDAAVRRHPSHAREEPLRRVVRWRPDRLELSLGAPVATPRGLVAREGVRVPLALAPVDVDADRDDVPDARGVLGGGQRGERAADRESEDVDAIDSHPHA